MPQRRRKRGDDGHVDPFFRARRRFEPALRALLLDELFSRMPRRMQEAFFKLKPLDPVLEFSPSFPADRAEYGALRKRLQQQFFDAEIEVDCVPITVRDFLSVILGLARSVAGSRGDRTLPAECLRFMDEAWPVLEACTTQHLPEVWDELHEALIVPLVAASRIDERLFFVRVLEEDAPRDKSIIRVIVDAAEAEMRRVELGGAARPMFRVGTGNAWNQLRWLSVDPSRLLAASTPRPTEPPARALPVYVQSHALRQLHDRVTLSEAEDFLQHWLYESLNEPNVIERLGDRNLGEPGDLLVEYRIADSRVGYLVVTVTDQLVAVRTFKFLTMEHTPEARLLKARLRLTRRDVDWLGLDSLSAFTNTDLCNDPVLRPLLAACGCEHLFSLSHMDKSPAPRPFAAEVKRYLRLAA